MLQNKIYNTLFVFLVISLIAVGCSEANQQPIEEIGLIVEEGNPIDDGINPDENIETKIVGITWMWERFEDTANVNNIRIDDPLLYTLVLNPNGTYEVKADCNLASGSYSLEGNIITLGARPTTLAECGSESLSNTFLTDLDNVVTFVIDGNNLVLNLWADAGNIVLVTE
ncbi:MAG: META domain-containing protein [Anaerolineaceae bacterium]|nr:META domain-containing protein [Anaerolineaceae bacterium]